MGLQDLNEELHGRDFRFDRELTATPYDPATPGQEANVKREGFEAKRVWEASERPSDDLILLKKQQRKRWLIWGLGGLTVAALLVGSVIKVRSLLYDEEQITVSMNGPRQVASAESSEFTVVYSNQNWSALENVSLIVSYPDSFQPEADSSMRMNASQFEIALGNIPARTNGKVTFSGKFYGAQGDTIYLKTRLRYSPPSVHSQFEKEEQYGVSVASSILSMEMLAPQRASNESVVEYALDYANRSDKSLSNIRVKLVYPEQFTFVSATPAPSEGDSVWYVGAMDPGKQGKILVRGKLNGARDEVKKAKAMIGYFGGDGQFVAYGSSEQMTRMVIPPLSITQTINGKSDIVVNAGDSLNFVLNYQNNGNIGLRDAIVTLKLDSEVLDYRKLERQSGSYDTANRTLIWKASDIPGLARLNPGEGGSIRFTIPVLNPIPASVAGTNFSLQTTAKIDSPDIPTPSGENKIIASNTLLTKVNSAVDIDFFLSQDDALLIGSGPIPPVAGQETLYTLKLRLSNAYNDVNNAKLTISLPSSSRYQKRFVPDTESVTFNERTNELVWDLATYRAARGEKRELRFQVAVTPDVALINQTLRLAQSIVFTGQDQFTKADIRVEHPAQSLLLEDESAVNMKVGSGN